MADGILAGQSAVVGAIEDVAAVPDLSLRKALKMQARSLAQPNYAPSGTEYTQNITINAPQELSPSEVARQTRIATQQMVLALRGV